MKENFNMEVFLKVLISLLAIFGAIIGALAIFDRLANKNRIKGDYLECDTQEDYEVSED